jgi:hypothetical protein
VPFNAFPFNSRVFNAGFANLTVYSLDSVSFENTSLNDGTNIVLTKPPLSGPARDILGGPAPRGDGVNQLGEWWRSQAIVLEGYLKASSASAMATWKDEFKKLLSTPMGDLDVIEPNGVVKRFVATCVNYDEMFTGQQRYHVTLVPFVAKFVANNPPFGRSREYVSTSLDVTTSPTVQSVVHAGSAKAKPKVTFIFSSASSVTAASVTNSTNGDAISYTGSLAAGDILVFDSEDLRVTKNGTAVTYSGGFPVLEASANLMSLAVTGTSFAAYVTISHRTTWL